jgi:ATP-dependent DNA helicase RecQ
VRAYAEAAALPVEMANERLPSIWRLREMQHLVETLRQSSAQLIGASDIGAMLRGSPQNQWTRLIAQGVQELGHELADKKMPALDVIEWLAEWAHDTRSAQRGLLLLTAHRAKGLEFDDVVIIDSEWNRLSKDEDPDAPRRLFYVAMTRARRSLSIVTAGGQDFLGGGLGAAVRRRILPDASAAHTVVRRYQMPDVQMVDLSYAGRLDAGNPALNAIQAARVGDPISLTHEGGKWLVKDGENRTIGRMAQRFASPEGLLLLRGTVGAIIGWRDSMRRDEWEVVLPELVFGYSV